jgi:hypothetical protein
MANEKKLKPITRIRIPRQRTLLDLKVGQTGSFPVFYTKSGQPFVFQSSAENELGIGKITRGRRGYYGYLTDEPLYTAFTAYPSICEGMIPIVSKAKATK